MQHRTHPQQEPNGARHPLDVLGALVSDEDDNGVDVHMVQPLDGMRGDIQKTVPVLRDNGVECICRAGKRTYLLPP